jgi:hypothetical protein
MLAHATSCHSGARDTALQSSPGSNCKAQRYTANKQKTGNTGPWEPGTVGAEDSSPNMGPGGCPEGQSRQDHNVAGNWGRSGLVGSRGQESGSMQTEQHVGDL